MLKDDDQTKVIIAYLEGIANGDRFRKVAGSLTLTKPLIVLKSGITSAGSRVAMSHTGSMAGANEICDAVFKQTGVIRAQSPEQLFDFAFGLSCQPLLQGGRLAVVTNAGGPGVMASDAIERSGLKLARLTQDTTSRLRSELPSFASLNNPVDLTGITTPDKYEREIMKYLICFPAVRAAVKQHVAPSEFTHSSYRKILTILFDSSAPLSEINIENHPNVNTDNSLVSVISELANSLNAKYEYTDVKLANTICRFKNKSIDKMRRNNRQMLEKAVFENNDELKDRLSKENAELARLKDKYKKGITLDFDKAVE